MTAPGANALRARLRDAVAAREAARERSNLATAAARRGEQLLAGAEAQLAACAASDRPATASRAAEIRAWASSGADQPPALADAEADTRRHRRQDAEERVRAARAATEALAEEVRNAAAALRRADDAVGAAATAVMQAEADAIGGRAGTSPRQTVWSLSSRLHGLGQTWLPDAFGMLQSVQLSQRALDALWKEQPPQRPISAPNAEAEEATRWRSYHRALIDDPEATLDAVRK